MPVLSLQQIEQDALAAGWPAADVPTIAAIVEAESGGNTSALNAPERGIGLAQITPGSHADYNPITNLQDALAKFQSQGWGAWTTWTGGQYQKFLGQAQTVFAGLPAEVQVPPPNMPTIGGAITGAVSSTGHGLANAATATTHNLGTWLKNWMPGLVVALVVALVLWGGEKQQ